MNIADNVPRYLRSELKLLTTQCVIIETEKLDKKLLGALLILKQYALHKCGHEGKPITGSKCLSSMLGKCNEKHYIVATQDRDLQKQIRNIPGVPLLYLVQKTPVLESPSSCSLEESNKRLGGRFMEEKKSVDVLMEKSGLAKEEHEVKRKKKKGPNPLSCKKKKKAAKADTNIKEVGIEKKRKRIRIPKHVKEELVNMKNVK